MNPFRRRPAPPRPPVNVRLITPDGDQVAVDCAYMGLDEDGLHEWQVVDEAGRLAGVPFVGVAIETLPAGSTVSIPVVGQQEGGP